GAQARARRPQEPRALRRTRGDRCRSPWRRTCHFAAGAVKGDSWYRLRPMDPVTVWVVAPPDDTGLGSLARPPAGVRFVIGSRAEECANAPAADVLLACAVGRRVFEPVFAMAASVRWVHSRSAGLDGLLFPALVEGPVLLTNARGVYSESLAEFVIAGALFFAKDFARMRRSQAAGRWDQFDVEEIAGRTLLVVGYGDIGRAAGKKAHAL